MLVSESCCYNLLLVAAFSSWSRTALLHRLLPLPLPARSGLGAGPCGAAELGGVCLVQGNHITPAWVGALLLLSSSSVLRGISACFPPSHGRAPDLESHSASLPAPAGRAERSCRSWWKTSCLRASSFAEAERQKHSQVGGREALGWQQVQRMLLPCKEMCQAEGP